MEATRRVSKDNVSNPFSDDYPFDVLEVGKFFELEPASMKGLKGAAELCAKYSVNGKTFVFSIDKQVSIIKLNEQNPVTYNITEPNQFIYITRTT